MNPVTFRGQPRTLVQLQHVFNKPIVAIAFTLPTDMSHHVSFLRHAISRPIPLQLECHTTTWCKQRSHSTHSPLVHTISMSHHSHPLRSTQRRLSKYHTGAFSPQTLALVYGFQKAGGAVSSHLLPVLSLSQLPVWWLILISGFSPSCATFDIKFKNYTWLRNSLVAVKFSVEYRWGGEGKTKTFERDRKSEERGQSTHPKALWRAEGGHQSNVTFQPVVPQSYSTSLMPPPHLLCCAPVVNHCWESSLTSKGMLNVCVCVCMLWRINRDDWRSQYGAVEPVGTRGTLCSPFHLLFLLLVSLWHLLSVDENKKKLF